MAKPSVSVIVAARNEEKHLPALIKALLSQEYPDFEVIIVNDRSSDTSKSLLDEAANHSPKLRAIHIETLPEGWTGKKYALSQGISQARKEIILLTDADCLPKSTRWISQMAGDFSADTDIVLGVSPYSVEQRFLGKFIQLETLWTAIQYLSLALAGHPYMGVGRNLAYRKALFEKTGFGEDRVYEGGDDDIFVSQHATGTNTRTCIAPEAQTLSIPKESWRMYFKQKIRHLSAGKRYRKKDQTRLGIFALASLVGWILFFVLIFISKNLLLILVLFGIRSLSFYSIFTRSGQKLAVNYPWWALPFFDLCYVIIFPWLGSIALVAKRIKWI